MAEDLQLACAEQVSIGGVFLKASRLILAAALVAFAAVAAKADAVDPTVIIRRVDPKPLVITSKK